MSRARTLVLTTLAMIAFAGNSLLCWAALKHTAIDAASFTAIRSISGADPLAGRKVASCPCRPGQLAVGVRPVRLRGRLLLRRARSTCASGALLLFVWCRPP